MAEPEKIRIGNAERDAALDALGKHMREGRLTPDEYSERAQQAALATTWSDLEPLFDDLPGGSLGVVPEGAAQLVAPASAPLPGNPPAPSGKAWPPPAPQPHGTGRRDWTAVAGVASTVLFFVFGFAFQAWSWCWLFFFLPGLVAVLKKN